jgi:hypothetical protein
MNSPAERNVRAVSDVYTELGVEWQVRFLGTHLHPGFEEATVAIMARPNANDSGIEVRSG